MCMIDHVLMTGASFEWTPSIIVVLAGLAAVILWGLITAVCKLYGRFYRDSDKHRRTVQATFLRFQRFQGKVGVEERGRLVNRNTPVMLEHCRVVFWVEDFDKELSFLVPVDSQAANWRPNQSGKLTYSGRRYIQFQGD